MNPIEEIASGLATLTVGVALIAGGFVVQMGCCLLSGCRFLLAGVFRLPGWIVWGGK